MSAEEADAYLRGAEEPKRSTLETLRRTILEIAPQAAQVISYGVPAFRAGGRTVAGIAAFEDHLSYLPFSGSVLRQPADEHDGYTTIKRSSRGYRTRWVPGHRSPHPLRPSHSASLDFRRGRRAPTTSKAFAFSRGRDGA